MGNKQKVRIRAKKVDRISRLSDDLLLQILSRLEIKLAVQTCILSKRWIRVWATLPHLNFVNVKSFREGDYRHDSYISDSDSFNEFVSEFLSKRNHSTDISTICLTSNYKLGKKLMNKVADYAISHNVQELSIDSTCLPKNFPHCVFSSPSLKVLKLITGSYFRRRYWACKQPLWNLKSLTTLHLESFILWDLSFPVLTTLHLTFCKLPLMRCSFPALTTLYLEDVTFLGKSLSFEGFVSLKNLTLKIGRLSYGVEVFSIISLNLSNLTISSEQYCKFLVSAPNLSYFEYYGRWLHLSSEDGFPCLEEVNIKVFSTFRTYESHELPPCIFGSPSLKKLRLKISDCANLEQSLWNLQSLANLHLSFSILPDLPRSFPVLTKLHLTSCKLPPMSWSLPALETLVLDTVTFLGDKSFSFEDFLHLKSLDVMRCTLQPGMEVFRITCLNLTNLTLKHPWGSQYCKFVVSAPNLSFLEYWGHSPLFLSVEDGFPWLEKVNIDFDIGKPRWKKYSEKKKQVIFQHLINMFLQIRFAKFLTLSFNTLKVISWILDFSVYQTSPFGHLKCLKLHRRPSQPEIPTYFPNCVINYLLGSSPGASIMIQDTDGSTRYISNMKMLHWTGSNYSVMESEDSSSDDENISFSSENHVSGEVDYSGEVAEQKKVHADEKHAKVQGEHSKDGVDVTIVQDANDEHMEIRELQSIDHHLDNAQREVRELQSRLDSALKEVQELQALRLAKMSDQIQ